VQCLPRATRLAMLEGISRNPIIVGAYTDQFGICPMLAAHRAGGRTSFIGFAKAWDAFAFRGSRDRRARRATERELLVLRTYLEASLLEDECPDQDLRAAAQEHRDLVARRASEPAGRPAAPGSGTNAGQSRPGDADRADELGRRPGWRWMRVVRSLDEYERALRALEDERQTAKTEAQPDAAEAWG
jgi:hypothetical protein